MTFQLEDTVFIVRRYVPTNEERNLLISGAIKFYNFAEWVRESGGARDAISSPIRPGVPACIHFADSDFVQQ